VVHGDAHVGNVYASEGAPGLLDWQMSAVGDPFHDVAYFVTSALEPRQRAAAERDLVSHYLERLTAHGGSAPPDAWGSYQRHLIHGLFWATNADGMYPETVNTTVVERFTEALSC
jgi:aminoglycoside phosphotransferase (APT) family kinase protein